MQSVGLVYQPLSAQARQLAEQCRKTVESCGYVPRLLSAWELDPSLDGSGMRMAVTFGGDGTVIRTARWLAGTGVPILGIAMGRLGFLTDLPPQTACLSLPSVLEGNYWVDERLMLSARLGTTAVPADVNNEPRAEHEADPAPTPFVALNDVVVARGASPRVVQIDVWVDEAPLVRYVADGVIVATPTGSTAYALAAGGPVLAPGVQGLAIVPIAAHLAVLHSLVVPVTARIDLQASSDHPALLVLDGQVQIPLVNNQVVTIELAAERTLFARTGRPTRFYETLMDSFKKR